MIGVVMCIITAVFFVSNMLLLLISGDTDWGL